VTAERAFLAALEGDCVVPLGALATWEDGRLSIVGMLADTEGTEIIRRSVEGSDAEAAALGRGLAVAILVAGGDRLRAALRDQGA
jgi:hydroxymethylbilane synthase